MFSFNCIWGLFDIESIKIILLIFSDIWKVCVKFEPVIIMTRAHFSQPKDCS